jgi:hypothetical protein
MVNARETHESVEMHQPRPPIGGGEVAEAIVVLVHNSVALGRGRTRRAAVRTRGRR